MKQFTRVASSLVLALTCLTPFGFAQNLTYLNPGHVKLVEPTYMPYRVQFTMDTGDSNCPAGGWVQWIGPSTDNNKSVYASLLAAMLSNRTVTLVYDTSVVHSGGSPCLVSFIHIQ